MKRINIAGIKEHEWFQKDYTPVVPYDDDDDNYLDSVLPIKEVFVVFWKTVEIIRKLTSTCFSVFVDAEFLIGNFCFLKQIDEAKQEKPTHINAFQLIGMASALDLSGFFEEEVRMMFSHSRLLSYFSVIYQNKTMCSVTYNLTTIFRMNLS